MKKMQKTCAVALAFSMILTSASVAQTNTVSAAKLKLNKTKATLKVGKTLKLKVKGAKKAKWSSNNFGVASVSSKGVVKAKRVGSAKITAKVKKKKLTCKITVKGNYKPAVAAPTVPVVPTVPQVAPTVPQVATPAPTPVVTQAPNVENNTNTISDSVLAENLSVVTQQLSDGNVLFTVTNNNSIAVPYYSLNYQLKTSEGKTITTRDTSSYALLNPGASQYLIGYTSIDDGAIVDVSKSVIAKSVETDITRIDASGSISVTLDASDDSDYIPYTAVSTDASAYATIVFLFYDASGNVVGAWDTLVSFSNNLTVFGKIPVPYNYTTGENLTYSSVKTFVYGYKYTDD